MRLRTRKKLWAIAFVVVLGVFLFVMLQGCEASSSIKGGSADLSSVVVDEKPTVTESKFSLSVAPPSPVEYRIVIDPPPEPKP